MLEKYIEDLRPLVIELFKKDSLDTIKNILSKIDLSNEQVEKICYCIKYHEQYNWNGNY